MWLIELRDVLIHPSCSNAACHAVWRLLVTRALQGRPQRMVSAVGVAVLDCADQRQHLCSYVAGDPDDTGTEVLTAFIEAAPALDLGNQAPFPLVA